MLVEHFSFCLFTALADVAYNLDDNFSSRFDCEVCLSLCLFFLALIIFFLSEKNKK